MDTVLLEAVLHICEDRCQNSGAHRAELDQIAQQARKELALSSNDCNKEYDCAIRDQDLR